MRRSPPRGFTLLEMMVATAISSIVILGAFFGLTRLQAATGRQRRAIDVVSPARQAMDVIGRDIRMAGDAATLFAGECLTGVLNPLATLPCPTVLDAHPWRITLLRNAWGANETFSTTDELPVGATFDSNPRNAVTIRFEPTREPEEFEYDGAPRMVVRGRLVRIHNPFGFAGEQPQRTILLDNVILDDAMRVDPATDEPDPRFDHSLFMVQLLGRETEFLGDPGLVDRTTTTKDLIGLSMFLTGPLALWDPLGFPAGLPAATAATAYTADYGQLSVRGLKAATGTSLPAPTNQLFANTVGGGDIANPLHEQSDIRRMLDQNRIRAIRVAFKVFDPREDPRLYDGLDLDGDPTNGTAAVYSLDSTFELRVLSGDRSGY